MHYVWLPIVFLLKVLNDIIVTIKIFLIEVEGIHHVLNFNIDYQ